MSAAVRKLQSQRARSREEESCMGQAAAGSATGIMTADMVRALIRQPIGAAMADATVDIQDRVRDGRLRS